MTIETPLRKVKHLGSARSGTTDFIKQRVTAVFMIPLLMWFVVMVVMVAQKSATDIPWLLTSPFSVIGAILFILNAFYHAWFGLKMIIEDYIHCHALKVAMLLFLCALIITTVVAGLVSIFSVHILLRVL